MGLVGTCLLCYRLLSAITCSLLSFALCYLLPSPLSLALSVISCPLCYLLPSLLALSAIYCPLCYLLPSLLSLALSVISCPLCYLLLSLLSLVRHGHVSEDRTVPRWHYTSLGAGITTVYVYTYVYIIYIHACIHTYIHT